MLSAFLIAQTEKRMAKKALTHKQDPSAVRFALGKLAGIAGLLANLLLFAAKLFAGLLSDSLSILADALNNLSDAGSSVVTLFGFRLAAVPPDEEHPFGHGRMEYLSAMMVAVLIILAGFELAASAVEKIFHPTVPLFSWTAVIILCVSIAVKLWMALFYRRIGEKIQSQTLSAAFADSRNDMLCTGVVLVSTLIYRFTGYPIDGIVGLLVAGFVMWSGFGIIKDAITPLLGEAPPKELVEGIRDTVLSYDGILGLHDLIIHNYGPGRCIVSLHAEVDCDADMMQCHDKIDRIEKELQRQFQVAACIHMDPIDTEDERVESLKELVTAILKDIDKRLALHDFRVVFGETHTNLVFDVVLPFRYPDEKDLKAEILRRVRLVDPRLCIVATLEHSYT